MEMSQDQQAFVLRIAPSRIDRVPEALEQDQIIIGWAEAAGLLDPNLSWEQFRRTRFPQASRTGMMKVKNIIR